MTGTRVDVHRASARARTQVDGRDTAHSFSFGAHYDPGNTAHGLLVVHNDDVLSPGAGYATHAHRDVEVVTWVLRGSLVHRDAAGRTEILLPGHVQRLGAGRGVLHSETNDAHLLDHARVAEPVRFVQAWVVPDTADAEPVYERSAVDDARLATGLVPVASGRPEHAGLAGVRLGQRAAALLVGRLRRGQAVRVPEAPYVHLFVARGVLDLEDTGRLDEGDAVRLTGAAGQRLTAREPAELLVWEMHAGLAAP